MKKITATILFGLGIIFILFTFIGRYIVLPGFLEGLEAGGASLEGASKIASTWKIIRYLLWAYSFKLGIYFTLLGALFRTEMAIKVKLLFGIGGFVYIGFAYLPLPAPESIVFGITGGIMIILMLYTIWRWSARRDKLEEHIKAAGDYRVAGYFFFAMATYTLCPLLGVKTFALSPDKMIQYGLQAEAASFAFHLLIELALGWLFTALSYHQTDTNKNTRIYQ